MNERALTFEIVFGVLLPLLVVVVVVCDVAAKAKGQPKFLVGGRAG